MGFVFFAIVRWRFFVGGFVAVVVSLGPLRGDAPALPASPLHGARSLAVYLQIIKLQLPSEGIFSSLDIFEFGGGPVFWGCFETTELQPTQRSKRYIDHLRCPFRGSHIYRSDAR